MIKTKIAYISYNGMNEALGSSQVLTYLYKLSSEYQYHLISLEKPEDFSDKEKMDNLMQSLYKKDIHWHPILYKTDKLGKLMNFFYLLAKTSKITKRENIKFAHCRSYFPAFVAYLLKLTYLFDTRGFAFDESADVGSFNRQGFVFKLLKIVEKAIYRNAAGINKLSFEGRRTILENELFDKGDQIKNISVIPTCVDLDRFKFIHRNYQSPVKIGYVGTAVGWYDFEKTLEVIKKIGEQIPYHFTIFNSGQHDYINEKLKQFHIPAEKVNLEKVSFQEMPERLAEFEIALFYIHPFFSKRASAATKLGELLATGIPVITNSGVGDHDFYINNNDIGKIIDFNDLEKYNFKEIFENLRSEKTSQKCREIAERYFSVEKGVDDYKNIYRQIFI
ncbi:glycosyltransferase family protein [Chryseobacterium caseinilyticum]|uniref:Glycosyltransferase n=1 Tax=Chryseobacterium caseinilyticum TaxID=2771428 RepID=A0ABR8ZH50_9FLAO|nr:hypothetical protein [Chryseobacterium caseinilyticum]MBD8084617.1 hypothetical protein [Chryseobacterium caseinilyticum]